MKKYLFLSMACLMALCAMAQIDAIKVTQGETTDWYPFGESSRIDVAITNGNIVFPNKTYDLANGNVETAFDTDPLPAIKEAAIAEIKDAAEEAKEEIDGLGVDEDTKEEGKEQIDIIVSAAKTTINEATNKNKIYEANVQAISEIYNVVQNLKDMWVIVRTDGTAGNWNTICMERNITAIDGATFWNVVGETDAAFTLEQVEAPFSAGYGYIIRYTKSELKVKYGDQVVNNPVDADEEHPIQGNFAAITCDQDGKNELVNNYVVYGNQLCKVTGWVTMADHRAYVIAGKAPSEAPAPTGAPRMTMPKPSEVPTSLGGEADRRRGGKAMKVIENGQFRIVKDNKMYTIMGVEE